MRYRANRRLPKFDLILELRFPGKLSLVGNGSFFLENAQKIIIINFLYEELFGAVYYDQ